MSNRSTMATPGARFRAPLRMSGLGIATLLFVAGCASEYRDPYFEETETTANVFVAPVQSHIRKVAILPFRAPTELIGSAMSDLFVTEGLRAQRYELVERSQMAKVLSESELALAGLSAARAVEVGNMLGADGVIVGTVDEYGTVPVRGGTLPVVGVSLRLIDCEDGKVMWSADLAKRADDRSVSLPEHARTVAHELVSALYRQWRVQPVVEKSAVAAAPAAAVSRAPAAAPAPPPAPPRRPQIAVSDLGLREVTIRWTTPAPGLTLRVERAAAAGGPFEEIGRIARSGKDLLDRGARNKPLADGKTYYYRAVAVSSSGLESEPSEVKESMTAPPPEPPASVWASVPSSRAVALSWAPSRSEGVVSYGIYRAPASDPERLEKAGTSGSTNFLDGGSAASQLKDSTAYVYSVSAVNRVGAEGPLSGLAEARTLPPPARIEGLRAQAREVRCVPLAWDPSPEPDVVQYDVYRRDEPDGPFQRVGSARGRETARYLDGGSDPGNLVDAREYAYRVRAVNAVTAEGPDSETASAVTRGAPPPVSGVKALSGQPREVPVAWVPSPDEKVIGYVVSRADAESETFSEVAVVTNRETVCFTDRGRAPRRRADPGGLGWLQDGTDYRYRVAAFNTAEVRSEWSAPATARTKPAPQAPEGLRGSTNLPKAVRLTWEPNPEKDIDRYSVESSSDGVRRFHEIAQIPAEPSGLAASESGQRDGVARHYRIRAVDQAGLTSRWSVVTQGSTKPLPAAPAEVVCEAGEQGATVRWKAPPQPDVTSYRVWQEGLLGDTLLGSVSVCEFVLTGERVGKGLSVSVSAVDADALESPRSGTVRIVPPAKPK